MEVQSQSEKYSGRTISKLWNGAGQKANRIAMAPLALPKNWTKVLRLGPGLKTSSKELFEVMF